ncbi:PhaM family polyhydroxyalkanoate granule multifunctional regulatory protein [Candidatus Burkholderia verschuerenii]|uniref:PhaM family polyhydroxyalkanoate granule multifunctional regulatory protein n=1 Tax=Candidatus Burkholderia verschuerenii TaxID=242163 RepID=UPI000A5CAA1F
MTDNAGGNPPFSIPGFPGFGSADMMSKMWEMMRLNSFAATMQGGGQGMPPSLSMMSDMMAPLTNIEELDKRVTDMRAVEHWLKLNLNMLQSAIQALEVQRATLATLRAFGAFAQTSVEGMQSAAASEKPKAAGWPMSSASKPRSTASAAERSVGRSGIGVRRIRRRTARRRAARFRCGTVVEHAAIAVQSARASRDASARHDRRNEPGRRDARCIARRRRGIARRRRIER